MYNFSKMEFSRIEENYVRSAYNRLNPINKCQGKLSFITNVLKNLSPNSLILDIGCGENINSRNDCFTIGIDICFQTKRNKNSLNTNLLLSDIMYLPFREGVFDIILIISILHHIPVEVLVPYNLEDIWRKGYLREISFNKFNTKEQRIILNSLPIYVISNNSKQLFSCFKLINNYFDEQNNNLNKTLILFEKRIKKTFKYFVERILNIIKEIKIKIINIWQNTNLLICNSNELEKFSIEFTKSIMNEAF
ncbi:Methyltransf_11 domain-containing protein, partial [Meloidogyne graminicola]